MERGPKRARKEIASAQTVSRSLARTAFILDDRTSWSCLCLGLACHGLLFLFKQSFLAGLLLVKLDRYCAVRSPRKKTSPPTLFRRETACGLFRNTQQKSRRKDVLHICYIDGKYVRAHLDYIYTCLNHVREYHMVSNFHRVV